MTSHPIRRLRSALFAPVGLAPVGLAPVGLAPVSLAPTRLIVVALSLRAPASRVQKPTSDVYALADAITGAEDFSWFCFAREVPDQYIFVGGKPPGMPEDENGSHYTPGFFIDESGMKPGWKTYLNLTLGCMVHAATRQYTAVRSRTGYPDTMCA